MTKRSSQISQRGFTLIELLVVISLIGVLATLAVVNYSDARVRARDAQRKANVAQIQAALELYRADQLSYPPSLPGACTSTANPLRNPGNTVTYIQKVPCDPKNNTPYVYTTTGSTYTLVACLENINDAQVDQTNTCSNNVRSYTLTNP